MVFQKLEAKPAYRIVAETIEESVIAGRLKPGDLLPTELELAEQFGVNRSTVREGLRLLEDMGSIGRVAGRRLAVVEPDLVLASSHGTRALLLQQITVRQIYEASLTLEPALARRAAQNATPEDLEAFKRNLEATEEAMNMPEKLTRLDREFHRLVAAATHNPALILMHEVVGDLFVPAVGRLLGLVDVPRWRLLAAHQAIVRAIEERDPETAALWIRRNLEDFERGCKVHNLDFDAPAAQRI